MPGTPALKTKLLALIGAAVVIVVLSFNALVAAPVASAIGQDDRNKGLTLVAYRAYAVSPSILTLDLWSVEEAAPVDLFRVLFQAAEALKDKRFDRVNLARGGHTVFVLDGGAFQVLGQEHALGQNPIYMIRTLPEKLRTPSGSPAFETWTGGWLGVLGEQMEDSNAFAQAWAEGKAPSGGSRY